jgi:hypothetical protein
VLRRLVFATAVLALLASTARASWNTAATGTGAAKGAALAAGSKPTAVKSGVILITVTLSWTATPGATGYVINRTGGVGSLGGTCTGTLTTTTCADSPVVTGFTYTYTVTPVRSGWTGAASPGTAIAA